MTRERPGCVTLGTLEPLKYIVMRKYAHAIDGWCQRWSDAPVGRSLQSYLTNVTPPLIGYAPPATFDKYDLTTHIVQNNKYELISHIPLIY